MASPVTVSEEVSLAVRKMTGTSLPAARSRRQTSNPSRSGSMTSRTIRSGFVAAALRSASLPLTAVVTEQPWNLSATWTSSRMFGSSSTTSTCGMRSFPVMTSWLGVWVRCRAVLWQACGTFRPHEATARAASLTGCSDPLAREYEPAEPFCRGPLGRSTDTDHPGILGARCDRACNKYVVACCELANGDLLPAGADHRVRDDVPGPARAIYRLHR